MKQLYKINVETELRFILEVALHVQKNLQGQGHW